MRDALSPREEKMATFADYVKNIFLILLLLSFAPYFLRSIKQQFSDLLEPKTKIGVIPVKGLLYNATTVIKDIKKFFEDSDIKAIVFKIDCPGGVSGTAQTIFNEINYFRSQFPNKYVVSIVENIAASGGYYVACATQYIIASPSAFIGSIGVYIQHPEFKHFIEYHNIKYEVIKTGSYKTAGNPLVELTSDQRKLLQSLTDNTYDQFVRDVVRHRPHVPADSKTWADGKIFTGEQALSLKLIDELGSPSSIIRVLKEKAHIEGKLEWVKPTKKGILSFFSSDDDDESGSYIDTFVNALSKSLEERSTVPRAIY